MKTLFLKIQERLTDNIEGRFHYDLFNDQVDLIDNEHPIDFPAIFFDIPTQPAQTLGRLEQVFNATVHIYVVQEPYGDTYKDSSNQERALGILDFIETVKNILCGCTGGGAFSPLTLKDIQREQIYGELCVFLLIFQTQYRELLPEPPGTEYVEGLDIVTTGELDPEENGVDSRPLPTPPEPGLVIETRG